MKKMFYFLDIGITQEDYEFFQEKLQLLDNGFSVAEIIDLFYHKIGEDNSARINKSFFLEAFVFIDFCKNKLNIHYREITWIYKQNFLLFNRNLYVFDEMGFVQVDIKNTCFVNVRYPWFNHIFRIAKGLGVEFFGINHKWDWTYNDKLYFVSKLYKGNLKTYTGDIIIPLINNGSDLSYRNLYLFIMEKFSTKQIVLKKTFGEMGSGVKAVDLNKIDYEGFVNVLKSKFVNTNNTTDSFYIVPFYEILYENRIYYTYSKSKNEFKIFAVKQKNTDFEGIFELESFELYKGIQVSWTYVDKNIVTKDNEFFSYLKKLVTHLGLETGVLEVGVLGDGEYRFFEVNPYGGTLMFRDDQQDVYDFYSEVYKNKFNSLI